MKKLVLLAVVVGFVVGVVPAWGYSAGDTIVFSNTNGVTDVDSVLCTQSQFSFCIPADGTDLPAGSVVQVKRIKLASRHSAFSDNTSNSDADSARINLNGIRSDTYAFSSDTMAGKCTIAYSFSSPCSVVVGTTYTAEDAVQAGVGRGVTLCADTGKRMMSSNIDKAAVVHGKTASGSIMVNAKTSDGGIYPLYEIEAEVLWIAGVDAFKVFDYSTGPNGSISDSIGEWSSSYGPNLGRYRIGPGGSGLVCDMGALASTPYSAMAAKTEPFSFAVYADIAQVSATGANVLLAFGSGYGGLNSSDNKLILYREGENVKLGFFTATDYTNPVGTTASLSVPASGYHLITGVCDPTTGGLTLYVDTSSATGGTAESFLLSAGFQFASIYNSNGNFTKSPGFALARMMGFKGTLTAEQVATLASEFPATDGTVISADIDNKNAGEDNVVTLTDTALTVYTSSAMGNQYLGLSHGVLTVPEGNTVTVPHVRFLNTKHTGTSVTLNVAGTVSVTSTMEDEIGNEVSTSGGNTHTNSPYYLRDQYKGILLGHWSGTGTYNIMGELSAPNAYLQTIFTASAQTINVNGGTLRAKGILAERSANSTINLTNGGKIEVGRLLNVGTAITRNFGKGTYSILSNGNDVRPINFTATGDDATVIDVNGKEVQFAGAWTGGGNVTLKSSDADGAVSILEYAGSITVEDGVQLSMVTMDSDAYEFGKTFSNLKFKSGSLKLYYRTQEITSQLTSQTEGGVTTYTLPPQGKVWTGAGNGTFSDAANWQGGVPASGEKFSIQASGEKTLSLDMASAVESPEVHVIGSGSLVIAGTGDGTLLAVTNLVIDGVAVTVNTAVFQPQTVTFLNGGSLAIGENGLLTDAVFTYVGALPTSGTAFTATTIPSVISEGTRWQGTVWFKELTATASGQSGWNFDLDLYGNAGSTVRFSGVSAFFKVGRNNFKPALEVVNAGYDYAWDIPNGYSCAYNNGPGNNSYYAYGKIPKLSGDGRIYCHGSGGNKALVVVADGSAFTGVLDLETKSFWFGDVIPEVPADGQSGIVTEGSVVVWPGATGALGITVTQQWNAVGGITIAGELKTSNLNLFTAVTTNTVLDTGTFTFMKTDTGVDDNSQNTDFGRVTGTGTIKYSGTGFCVISTNNFPTSMAFEAANGKGTVVPYVGAVVGSLSGSGDLRSDWESQSVRNLTILQATNTTWSGVFNYNYDRIDTVTVSPGVASSGTLTLAGTQTQENKLTIATNASVNITGKWVGPVSVAGTIAGTGTIDGALVVSDGATIKVNGADPLNMTGNVILSGDIAIVVADDVDVSQLTILSVTGNGATLDASLASFTVRNSSGEAIRARVVAKSKELRLSKNGFYIHLK